MIADMTNPPARVFLDGVELDLTITIMASDEEGVVEQLVVEDRAGGMTTLKTDVWGNPLTIIKRGDVRILWPTAPTVH